MDYTPDKDACDRPLDAEWAELLKEARKLDISLTDIRDFFSSKSSAPPVEM